MRASRRGMVDLIIMIVMIVFLLGMGTLAFLTYDKAEKEKQYLSALREIPARQQAELDAVKARYTQVSELIGFKGEAAYSSPSAIEHLLEQGSYVVPDYYDVDPVDREGEPLKGTKSTKVKVKVYKPDTDEWVDQTIDVQVVNDTTRKADKIYDFANNVPLRTAIGRQDNIINQLFSSHIPQIKEHREFQQEYKELKAGERIQESEQAYASVESKIENSNAELKTKQEQVASAEQRLAESMKDENSTYIQLDSESMRDAREQAFAEAREAAKARAREREAMEAYRLQADERRVDDSRDPDGYVFLVDKRSGWVWINIGQRSDVRLNQTFQVLRPDASRSSEISIGEIRVKEILRGNIARARVDALDDPDTYPEAGDLIQNPNYSARQYEDWALVGEFGGRWSNLTKQQLTDLLRSVGFNVQSKITATTDAVIIGGNWVDDPDWQDAEDRRLSFEKYTEEEVLYFLGLSGPDRQE